MLSLLDISGVDYDFEEVDIFMGKHQDVKYLAKNPCGTIPMVVDQECQLMGNPSIFVNYLTATKPKLQSYMPREHSARIEQYMNWYQSVLRPCTRQLIKVTLGPKTFGHEMYSGEEVEAAKNAFFDDILKRVNTMLEGR